MTPRAKTSACILVALAVLACTVAVSARAIGRSEGENGAGSDPAAAVRDFLISGALDHNGYQACVNLTPAEQRKVRRRAGVSECRDAFDNARLALGGREIQTVHEVERLPARVARHGRRANVWLGSGPSRLGFRLVPANFAEQEEFLPPNTEWRIAGGALPLVPRGAHE